MVRLRMLRIPLLIGAHTVMTTHKHASLTKSRPPVASTPESLIRGRECHDIKPNIELWPRLYIQFLYMYILIPSD